MTALLQTGILMKPLVAIWHRAVSPLRATWSQLKRHPVIAALLGIAALLQSIDGLFGTQIMPWVLKTGLPALLNVQLGIAGLGIAIFVAVLAGTTVISEHYAARRGIGSGERPIPAPLSAEDKDAVARIRTLWHHDGGSQAVGFMLRLISDAVDTQPLKRRYYKRFLEAVPLSITQSVKAFEDALAISENTPLETVINRFNELFSAYLRGAELLYQIHQNDVRLFDDPLLTPFNAFRRAHRSFRDRLIQATEFPCIHRRLMVFASPGFLLESRQFLEEQPWDGDQPPPLLP